MIRIYSIKGHHEYNATILCLTTCSFIENFFSNMYMYVGTIVSSNSGTLEGDLGSSISKCSKHSRSIPHSSKYVLSIFDQ